MTEPPPGFAAPTLPSESAPSVARPRPMRRRSRWDLPPLRYTILALTLAVALGVGVAALTSPWFAFSALRSAAQAGDRNALAELVDTDAVRAGLYPQVDARLPLDPPEAPRAAAPPPDPRPRWLPDFIPWPLTPSVVTEALRPVTRPIERPVRIRRRIDELTTPEALAGMVGGRARVRDWALRRFRVEVVGAEGPTVLSFHRTGLFDWRLVGVTLPPPPEG